MKITYTYSLIYFTENFYSLEYFIDSWLIIVLAFRNTFVPLWYILDSWLVISVALLKLLFLCNTFWILVTSLTKEYCRVFNKGAKFSPSFLEASSKKEVPLVVSFLVAFKGAP